MDVDGWVWIRVSLLSVFHWNIPTAFGNQSCNTRDVRVKEHFQDADGMSNISSKIARLTKRVLDLRGKRTLPPTFKSAHAKRKRQKEKRGREGSQFCQSPTSAHNWGCSSKIVKDQSNCSHRNFEQAKSNFTRIEPRDVELVSWLLLSRSPRRLSSKLPTIRWSGLFTCWPSSQWVGKAGSQMWNGEKAWPFRSRHWPWALRAGFSLGSLLVRTYYIQLQSRLSERTKKTKRSFDVGQCKKQALASSVGFSSHSSSIKERRATSIWEDKGLEL